MFLDGVDGRGAAFGFTDHGDQAGLGQHHFGEFVHASSSRRTCGAYGFIANRVNGAHVVNDAVGEIDRQFLALGQHVLNALVRCVTACEHFAVEQKRLARLPTGDFSFGERIEIYPLALLCVGRPVDVRPKVERWWV